MEHLFRLLKHLIVFFLICLPLMVLGIFTVFIALLFVSNTQYKLPWPFRWWDNADLYTGRDTSSYEKVCQEGKIARYKWLVFRNPINYFDYIYLGLVWNGREIYVFYNPANDDVGDGTRPGFRYIEVAQPEMDSYRIYYEYYLIYQYPFAKKYCFRYRMGWKIGNNNNPPNSYTQWVLTVNPFQPFTGS